MTCKWNGRGEPRILPGRHGEECPSGAAGADLTGELCSGCRPCTERHCVVCSRAHADGACPGCIAASRDDLAAIRLMCGALPEEVAHRGVNGEALMLLGPTADPEAWGYMEASYLAGRLPEGWFEATHGRDCPTLHNEPCVGCTGDELHPLAVLGTWEMVWRDFLEHDSDAKVTVEEAAAYLDRNLAYMAEQGDVPFGDFARDVRRSRGHLEDVLHDGEQVETGAPCMSCEVPLQLNRGDTEARDFWECPRCKETSTVAQYLFAVQNEYRKRAMSLTARDMAKEYEVPEGSVRAWASEKIAKVRKRGKDHHGLQLYDVADVLAMKNRHAEGDETSSSLDVSA